jgi:prefoldin subunit 5
MSTKKINNLELSIEAIDDIQQALKSIETQLILVDDSVQALNSYKRQLNQSILEIQTEISTLQQLDKIEEPLN